MDILLVTLNARYSHASLGLRYLKANLHELEDRAEILEFTIQQNKEAMLEEIYRRKPKVVGFGIYIWNFMETTSLIKDLRALMPEVIITIGGPEVSYEYEDIEIYPLVDYLITGWGDVSFYQLMESLLVQQKPWETKVIKGIEPPLDEIKLPYYLYNEEDIKHRTVYIEASRGCPFKCEFCLSSLDKTAWRFPQDAFLAAMDDLYERGLRQYKFVDRTFNLKKDFTLTILNFFLDKLAKNPEEALFLHFELVPDYLSDELKEKILEFPDGSLQFEIGIQTLNTTTQHLISRKTNLTLAKENISWLSKHTDVHLHVDLIVGLPDEDLESFAEGFNELWSWEPQEIQVGILKRLKGVPIIRHSTEFAYSFSQEPPYSILKNRQMPFFEVMEMERFAKFWDNVANSGRFKESLPAILGDLPFQNFRALAASLSETFGRAYGIALDRLFKAIFEYLTEVRGLSVETVREVMREDFLRTGIKGWPKYLGERPDDRLFGPKEDGNEALPQRQRQHRAQ
ncbi:B12-binding domain-containing radical SAM protein [Ignatzschineria sp. LJL83]